MKDIIVFSNEWFDEHQSSLLKFANTRFGRYILRINGKRSDVKKNRIIKIQPHAITWLENNQYKTEFRTHAKFSKRLYHAFKPLWHLIHLWDMQIANRLDYSLNLGFDTLTAYPDASVETDTMDGYVYNFVSGGDTWAAIHDATSGTSKSNSSPLLSVSIHTNFAPVNWGRIDRSYVLFNTSSIGSSPTINSATLSLYGDSTSSNSFSYSTFAINVYSSTPISNTSISLADYNKNKFGTTEFSTSKNYSSWSTTGYNEFTFNASGLSSISSTSISKYGLREATFDVPNTTPTWESGSRIVRFLAKSSDNSGTSFDPKLVVTYTYFNTASVSNANPYANGKLMSNSGSGWSNVSNSDLYFVTYTTDGATTIAYNSQDPSNILSAVVDNYNVQGGNITYTGTIDTTSTTVSYTFNTQTILQCINKIIELCPYNWYWYVDYATNLIHLHEKSTTADHTFTLGKDIRLMRIEKRIEDVVNTVYFSGGNTGSGENLYLKTQDASSVGQYGLRAKTYSDQRVTLSATATTISNNIIQSKSTPEIRLNISIADSNVSTGGYDIETIKIGDIINIRNVKGSTGSSLWDVMVWDVDYWDYNLTQISTMYLQIVRIEYSPDFMQIFCSTTPPDITKRIEDINRNLETVQTLNNPTTPA